MNDSLETVARRIVMPVEIWRQAVALAQKTGETPYGVCVRFLVAGAATETAWKAWAVRLANNLENLLTSDPGIQSYAETYEASESVLEEFYEASEAALEEFDTTGGLS